MAGWAIRAGGLGQVAAALIMAIAAIPGAAHAEGRVALVVGNAAYTTGVGPLANPVKDAALIADALAARQFAVTRAVNLDRVQLLKAIDTYAHRLAEAGPGAVGFVYYSGHGAANPDNGRNYLIPVDAQSASDSTLWYQSVPLQEIVETISKIAPQAANIVVFDACREALRLPGGKTLGDGGKGLHRESARPSVLIAFSTSPDAIAADLDRSAATGPYATELAAALAKPGVDLEAMFSDVKYGVLSRTGDKQLPYIENGLRARVVLGGGGVRPTVAVPTALPSPSDPYVRWGLTKRDFGQTRDQELMTRAGVASRFAELSRAAELGDPVALTLTGLAYQNGIGTKQDYAKAMNLYRKAASMGEARALVLVAKLYFDGRSVQKDIPESAHLMEKAAVLGNETAMNFLSVLYRLGLGFKQDYNKAIEWLQKAVDRGDPEAMLKLGYYYQDGRGVNKDITQAMILYRRAADMGQTDAMVAMGDIYDNPRGMNQNYAEAMNWFKKAADLGAPNAMVSIGYMHYFGHGVPKDQAEAMRWYQRASNLGDTSAMVEIGNMHRDGEGVPQNYAEARRWYEKAAALGSDEGKGALIQIEAMIKVLQD